MQENDLCFDLQLFADEGGAEDGSAGAEAGAAEVADSGQGETEGAKAPDGNQESKAGAEKTGTILGGTEDEAAWDFSGVVPEGMAYDKEAAAAFAAVAKEAGLTGAQAQTIAGYGMKYAQEGMNAMARAYAEQIDGWGKSARTELGASFDSTVQAAGTGIEALENLIPGVRQALNETGAGNRVELIRAFALIGNLVGEDTFKGFGSAAGAKASARYPNTNFEDY